MKKEPGSYGAQVSLSLKEPSGTVCFNDYFSFGNNKTRNSKVKSR